MSQKVIKYSIIAFSWLAVLLPLWMSAKSRVWALDETLPENLMPLFGMAAFMILWLHVVGPAFEPWLTKYVDFQKFLNTTSPLILILMLLHPLTLLIVESFKVNNIILIYGAPYIVLGLIGLLLLLVFDVGEAMRRHQVVEKHWTKILIISTIGFLIIFFHSLLIGSSLQSGALRILWILYGVSAILSAAYVYIFKKTKAS